MAEIDMKPRSLQSSVPFPFTRSSCRKPQMPQVWNLGVSETRTIEDTNQNICGPRSFFLRFFIYLFMIDIEREGAETQAEGEGRLHAPGA